MLDNKKHLLLRGILFLIVLCVGLYFGIRIGEGRYNFYKPQSPYYSRATLSAHNKGYDEGYSDGCKDKQAADYNSGWSAGYDFCLNENKTIRNDYDEGFSAGSSSLLSASTRAPSMMYPIRSWVLGGSLASCSSISRLFFSFSLMPLPPL